MTNLNRRAFLHKSGQGALIAGFLAGDAFCATSAETKKRKMTMDLLCGNLGISATQVEAIDLAARHGFESVGADGGYLATLDSHQVEDLKSSLRGKGVVFGAAGLPVEFRQDDARFDADMQKLPRIAAGLQR